MTQIISFAQEKGGVGKTTLLTCIASLCEKDGAKILICDADPQQNAVHWASLSPTGNIDFANTDDETKLDKAIEHSKNSDYDIILIDTAGIHSSLASYAIALSNLIIVPFDTSQYDLNGAINTIKLIQRSSKISKNKLSVAIVANRYNSQHTISKNITKKLLKQGDEFKILYGCPYLTGFKKLATDGGLPTGNALKAANSFIASLQIDNLIDFYNK